MDLPGGFPVVLAVRDTGVGMDEETRDKLFEPFFTTKGIGHGTGLSLATVYEIVKQCGGQIRVESRPNEGACFRIFFPRALEKSVRPRPALSRGQGISNRETVLLVEDENEVRTMIHEVLGKSGYTVLEARDAGDALHICERHAGPIHLMVTDVVMPDLSGCELARRLGPIRPEMRVLYMSGHAQETIERRRGQGIPGAFLEKPFTPDLLSAMIRRLLDRPGSAEA
jgi:CheY-like chemotaxis protein